MIRRVFIGRALAGLGALATGCLPKLGAAVTAPVAPVYAGITLPFRRIPMANVIHGDRYPIFLSNQLDGLSIEERKQLYIRTWEKLNGRPYDGSLVDMSPRVLQEHKA